LSTKTALNSIGEWYPALSAYLRGSQTYTVAALLVRADVGAIIREVPLIRVTFEVDARYLHAAKGRLQPLTSVGINPVGVTARR
jgi:hypothetical protein